MEYAADFRKSTEILIAELQHEAETLPGKEFHKERVAREKEIMELQGSPRYVDACRVTKGLAPVHGYFVQQVPSPTSGLSRQEAAAMAAKVEMELKALEPEEAIEEPALPAPGTVGGRPEDADKLIRGWERRVGQLESKTKTLDRVPPRTQQDTNELEKIAEEIVWFRTCLKKNCGYSDKDLHHEDKLVALEDRLDKLADVMLRDEEAPKSSLEEAADGWRKKQQTLLSKIIHDLQVNSKLSPAAAKELERLMTEVVELKAELRAKGLNEHEQDKDERVLTRLVRLEELRQWGHRDKKQSREHKDILEMVQGLRDELDQHKRRMRDELGLKQQELKHDTTVAELEERFSMLCKVGGA